MTWKFKVLQIPKIPYRLGLGLLLGKRILLLSSEGRISKKVRVTALQYDIHKNNYYIGSMRGVHADWYKNIQNNNSILMQIGNKRLKGTAYPISCPNKTLNFMKLRLSKHPIMLRIILSLDGVKNVNDESQMSNYAERISYIKIKPILN